tara:strand:+ start:171 stop:1820 length:1650 start_codon:yes stop_codon:yes gene_type:complete
LKYSEKPNEQSARAISQFRETMLARYEIESDWPVEVVEELTQIEEELPGSKNASVLNLTHLTFVTIDGEDAKDFDDAVFCEQAGIDFHLDVAIADVSRWVESGGAVDREASKRGNSVYLPGHVVPMLPELLSNDLCSLRAGEPRQVLVCRMRINSQGVILGHEFVEAEIVSAARLTYQAASEFLTKQKDDSVPSFAPKVEKNLLALSVVSELLFARRMREGSLHLVFPETVALFGPQGYVEELSSRPRLEAACLIEECMLAANVCAAQRLDTWFPCAMYRCHDTPDPDALKALRDVFGLYGFKIRLSSESEGAMLNDVLKSVPDGHPASMSLHMLVLRSMKQAYYSRALGRHFGLGFSAYTHFTSPIRRYPDLIAHRMLKQTLGYPASGGARFDDSELSALAQHCSVTERAAEAAEREMMAWLKTEFMTKFMGEEFSGTVSGVTAFGLFITLQEFPVDGLVHISDLGGDYFEFDERFLTLTGRRSGRTLRLGDRLTVRVAGANLQEGKISFSPAESRMTSRASRPRKMSRVTRGKRGLGRRREGRRNHR